MEERISLRIENPAKWVCERIDWLAIISLAFLYMYGAYLILFGEPADWVNLIMDDGYFYLGIVRGIVEAGSSSFLPPFETNGYQPLWTILLSGSALLFGTSDAALALQLHTICYGFAGAFAWMSKRKFGFAFPAIASAAIFSGASLQGMETAMLPILILGFFYSKSWSARGVFSSLIFLTRLDALALVAARDAYFFLSRREADFRHYLILVPVVAAYFVFNYFAFGVAVPVSGLAKSIGNVTGENLGLIYLHADSLSSSLYLVIGLIVFSIAIQGRAQLRFKDELLILSAALIVICLYYSLRSGWSLWPWYYWPEMMIFFYATTSGIFLLLKDDEGAARKSGRYIFSLAAVLGAFAYAMFPAIRYSQMVIHARPLSGIRLGSFLEKNVELAQLIKAGNFPGGTFFAMGDRAGSFGFFIGRRYRFIQTEGLVGPYSYYQSMKNGEGEEFLARHGVDYLVADRDRFLEDGEFVGVIEPVQPLSSKFGQYMVCFRRSDVVIDQTYFSWNNAYSQRYVFDFSRRTACPDKLLSDFEGLRKSYGALRRFMLYSEYKSRDSWIAQSLNKIIPIPEMK